MRVRFRTNLGSDDAGRFGLDYRDCTRGAEIEVPNDVGIALLKFADRCDTESRSIELRGIPPADDVRSADSAILELEGKHNSLEAKMASRRRKKTNE